MIYFIPARKGSERLPNKNTIEINGKPLIQWTFDALQEMNLGFSNKVIVSSDDDDVLALAKKNGFKAIRRDEKLCQSDSKMNDVLFSHVKDFRFHYGVCVLYPTSPLRNANHIKEANALWVSGESKGCSLMSVSPVTHRPFGLLRIEEDGMLAMNRFQDGCYQAQNTPVEYRANGAIYMFTTDMIKQKKVDAQLFTEKTVPYIMSAYDGAEVDTKGDLIIAESLMKSRSESAVCVA